MKKYYFFIPFMAVALLASASLAMAENDDKRDNGNLPPGLQKQIQKFESGELFKGLRMDENIVKATLPSSLAINPNGDIRINEAKVTSVPAPTSATSTTGSLTIKVWGMTFTLNITADSKLYTQTRNLAITDIKVGDSVDVSGTVSESAPGVVQVRQLKDRTQQASMTSEEVSKIRLRIQELIERLNILLGKTNATTTTSTNP